MKIFPCKLLLFAFVFIGCYSMNKYNYLYNQNVDALNPYKNCELECIDSCDIHCHWEKIDGQISISAVNHEWIQEKCNYDLCVCMLESISENYKIASQTEAIQYCYINNLWVQNGEEGDVFDYEIWKKEYLEQEKEDD